MQPPSPLQVAPLGDVETRQGVRSAVKSIWSYLSRFFESDFRYKSQIASELTPLYGEAAYAPGSLADGAQATISITVPGATFGYTIDLSYDKTLQALQATAYVSAANTVTVVLKNNTGGAITLAAGRWRAYVWARILSA